MIVSCPACSTSFAVDDSLIGPSGRKVRCAKCAHRWHQMPVLEMAEAEVAAVQAGAVEAPVIPAAAAAAPMPEIVQSTSAQMAAIAAAISEKLAVAPEAGSAPPVAELTADMPMSDIPAAVIRPRAAKGDEKQKVVTAKPRKRRGLLLLGIVLGVLIAVPAAGYVWRAKIARSAPWAQDMYSILGIRTDDAAEDLEVSNLKPVKRDIDGKPAVEVTGTIFNKAQYAVEIPLLAVTALSKEGKPMPNPYKFRLQQQILEPGQTASFRVVYEAPPAGFSGVNVGFADSND